MCRQTNFILKVAEQGLPVNIKKGQFLAPWDMTHVAEKAKSTGNQQIMLCDRGTSFGYNTLVSDMLPLVFSALFEITSLSLYPVLLTESKYPGAAFSNNAPAGL